MNRDYLKMIVVITAIVICTSISVRASKPADVRHISGKIGWIDTKLGKLHLQSDLSEDVSETIEYKINQDETRVTDPLDKKFLTINDLQKGQYITLEVMDGQPEKIIQKIIAEPPPALLSPDPDREAIVLKLGMRKLWEEHITYTRNYIISELADLGDKDSITKRLLSNQQDIGAAISPYYGDEAGRKLAGLLRDHILIATEVVQAAKMDHRENLTKAQTKWNANADDISAFLSSANPHWVKSDMTAMLHKHLEYTTQEVVSRLKKYWIADIDAYDRGHHHMLMFADVLTKGIVKQFPEKFERQ